MHNWPSTNSCTIINTLSNFILHFFYSYSAPNLCLFALNILHAQEPCLFTPYLLSN